MKDIFKLLIKYIFIILILFSTIFIFVIFYNIIPYLRISLKGNISIYIKNIIYPSFLYAIFNSFIISLFAYGVIILNYQNKRKFIAFFIPVIISSLLIFILLFFLKPKLTDINFHNIDNAKVFFKPNIFITNNKRKLYFDNIEDKKIKNVLIINDIDVMNEEKEEFFIKNNKEYNNISFYNNCNVVFIEDKILLEVIHKNGKKESITFMKESLDNFISHYPKSGKYFFKYVYNIIRIFLYFDNIYIDLFLWISVSFSLLSLTQLTKIKSNRFLSFIYNLLFLILFYIGFSFIVDLYLKISMDLLSKIIFREAILILVIIITGFIFQGMRLLFVKHEYWEEE